jgi:hypothetical protein
MIGTLDTDRYALAMPWLNAASMGIVSGVVRVAVSGNNADVTAGAAGLWCRAGPQWPGCTPRFRVSVQVAT